MTIGERIRLRREALGMSQDALARKMGYKSRSSINKIELGLNDIPQSKIDVFAKALNVTPSFLMGWDAPSELSLTEKEEQLIQKYRDNPSMQKAVDTLLGIDK